MSEWWSYRPSDFLMFSPRAYYRQIESFNTGHWPLHLILAAIGIYLIFALFRRRALHFRASHLALAALWAFVALDYLRAYLSTIHWGATYASYAFLVQALLLVVRGFAGGPAGERTGRVGRSVGTAVILAATVVYPMVAILAGRGYEGSEVIGATPTPTALATLGFLIASPRRGADYVLMIIPILWCLLESMTIYTMRQPDWWVSPTLASLAMVTVFGDRPRWNKA